MMGRLGMHPMGMGMNMGMSGFRPAMLGGSGLRSRHSPYYIPSYNHGYGGGGRSGRYLDPYDMFDDVFDEDWYMDDYDDIEDPLQLLLRMQRVGGGGRRRRRGGRYARFEGGGLGYCGLL